MQQYIHRLSNSVLSVLEEFITMKMRKKLHLSMRIKNGEIEVRGTLSGWFEGIGKPQTRGNFWEIKHQPLGLFTLGSQTSKWIPMKQMVPVIRDFCARKRNKSSIGEIRCMPCKKKDAEKMIAAFMKLLVLRSKAQ